MKKNVKILILVLIVASFAFQGGCPPQVGPTVNPIVLAHGFGGWNAFVAFEYFYKVKDYLQSAGFEVYASDVSPVNSIAARAQDLKEDILSRYPNRKVNIIAHSMGGLDARYMITHLDMADQVASVTTIATPHRGTSVADVAVGILPGSTEAITDFFLNIVGLDWDGVTELTMDYVRSEFNPSTPDHPDVSYFSYGGNSLPVLSPLLVVPAATILVLEGMNDGLVSVISAQWGSYLGTLNADHIDEIGQIAGITDFDFLGFYLDHAKFLKAHGF